MSYLGEKRGDGIDFGDSLINLQKKEKSVGKHDYLHTLLNPLDLTASARIPDFNGHPVSVYTDQIELTIAIKAGNGTHGFTVFFENGGLYVINEATGAIDDCTYTAASVVTPGTATASNLLTYRASRLVSAGFQMEFIGNDSNNAGMTSVAYLSKPDWGANGNTVTTALKTTQTALQNTRLNWSGPLKNGCKGTYRPLDPQDFLYGTPLKANPAWNTVIDYVHMRAAFQVHMTANNDCSIRVTAVGHFEGMAIDDTTAAGPALHALFDPLGTSQVINTVLSYNALGGLSGARDTGLQYGRQKDYKGTLISPPDIARRNQAKNKQSVQRMQRIPRRKY